MRTAKTILFTALTALCLAAPVNAADTYEVDAAHSYLNFAVKHLNVAYNYGRFNKFEGKVMFDEANPANSSFELTVFAESIDTANDRRDQHLRNTDFFSANQFPTVTFKSTEIKMTGDKTMAVTGDLTILGKTEKATFNMEITGAGPHPRGGQLMGFHGTGTFMRSKYGMNYGLDNGALGDEIKVIISLETKKG